VADVNGIYNPNYLGYLADVIDIWPLVKRQYAQAQARSDMIAQAEAARARGDYEACAADLAKAREFDEGKVHRDNRGRFSSGSGGTSEGGASEGDEPTTGQKSRFSRFIDAAKAKWQSAKPVLASIAFGVGSLGIVAAVIAAAEAHRARSERIHQAEFRAAFDRAMHGGAWRQARQEQAASRTDETDAQTAVRLAHGVRAARAMALYERPGTPGEKAAAAAALERMGVDVSRYAKAAAQATIWNALDHLISEDEASRILDALKDTLTAGEIDAAMHSMQDEDQIGKAYNPDQLRDWRGRFSGPGGQPAAFAGSLATTAGRISSIARELETALGSVHHFSAGQGDLGHAVNLASSLHGLQAEVRALPADIGATGKIALRAARDRVARVKHLVRSLRNAGKSRPGDEVRKVLLRNQIAHLRKVEEECRI
jgi:hypothetical protein